MEKRIRVLGIFLVLCFLALFIQLNNIQIVKAHSLATNPLNPRVIAQARIQPRGEIISSNGQVVAESKLTSNPIDPYQRVYPAATASLFADIVGFDSFYYGMDGVEASYNGYLKAHTRPARSLADLLVNRTTTDNVTLTVNSKLQAAVAAALASIPGAPPAAAVVVTPSTGAIDAMYSSPSYNPNPLVSPSIPTEIAAWTANLKASPNPMLARAYRATYAPGSTFKLVTSSAVYDHQPALATKNYPPHHCIHVPDTTGLLCNYGRGTATGPEYCGGTIVPALAASCDIVFAQLGMALGGPALAAEAHSFGFNQRIPLDLPYVVKSVFPPPSTFVRNAPQLAFSAFGQGSDQASALQMAMVAAGIANKGVIMTPHVMADIRDSQGALVTSYTPKPWLRATSAATAASVTSLMRGVVTMPIGTAYGIFPAGEDVAAKTGTAQTGHHTINDWMVAFAPARQPRVAVAMVVPNQAASTTGAGTVGPVIRAIVAAALAQLP
ncbi:MAG: penicillin-binding transpeptidase domain-containing protein [Acidimicrobiales bacterium]